MSVKKQSPKTQLRTIREGFKSGKHLVFHNKKGFQAVKLSELKRLNHEYQTSLKHLIPHIETFVKRNPRVDTSGSILKMISEQANRFEECVKNEKMIHMFFGPGRMMRVSAHRLRKLGTRVGNYQLIASGVAHKLSSSERAQAKALFQHYRQILCDRKHLANAKAMAHIIEAQIFRYRKVLTGEVHLLYKAVKTRRSRVARQIKHYIEKNVPEVLDR